MEGDGVDEARGVEEGVEGAGVSVFGIEGDIVFGAVVVGVLVVGSMVVVARFSGSLCCGVSCSWSQRNR